MHCTVVNFSFKYSIEWNNGICSNIDGPGDDHTKWSKSDKDKHHNIIMGGI